MHSAPSSVDIRGEEVSDEDMKDCEECMDKVKDEMGDEA